MVVEDHWTDYEIFSDTLPDEYFPKGSNWLMLGPSGPRRLRLAVEHLCQYRGGICFCVDLDPLTAEPQQRDLEGGQAQELLGVDALVPERDLPAKADDLVEAEALGRDVVVLDASARLEALSGALPGPP